MLVLVLLLVLVLRLVLSVTIGSLCAKDEITVMLNTTANNFTFFMAPAPYSITALGQLTDIYRARSEKITRVIAASWLQAFELLAFWLVLVFSQQAFWQRLPEGTALLVCRKNC
jgi:hypothetical protein